MVRGQKGGVKNEKYVLMSWARRLLPRKTVVITKFSIQRQVSLFYYATRLSYLYLPWFEKVPTQEYNTQQSTNTTHHNPS